MAPGFSGQPVALRATGGCLSAQMV